jgi:uncharacterized cupin superfamily protein
VPGLPGRNQAEELIEATLIADRSSRVRSGSFGRGTSSTVPPGTEHIFVGARDKTCVILLAGARLEDEQLHYPVSELAARYGARVEEETTDFKQVYVRFEPPRRERPSYWDRLPWS